MAYGGHYGGRFFPLEGVANTNPWPSAIAGIQEHFTQIDAERRQAEADERQRQMDALLIAQRNEALKADRERREQAKQDAQLTHLRETYGENFIPPDVIKTSVAAGIPVDRFEEVPEKATQGALLDEGGESGIPTYGVNIAPGGTRLRSTVAQRAAQEQKARQQAYIARVRSDPRSTPEQIRQAEAVEAGLFEFTKEAFAEPEIKEPGKLKVPARTVGDLTEILDPQGRGWRPITADDIRTLDINFGPGEQPTQFQYWDPKVGENVLGWRTKEGAFDAEGNLLSRTPELRAPKATAPEPPGTTSTGGGAAASSPPGGPSGGPSGPPPAVLAPTGGGPQGFATANTRAQIRAEAVRQGRDPDLMEALAQQESGFNPEAVSPKGAIGLFQIMPATAAELGGNPRDVAQNIEMGVRYFGKLLDSSGGDEKLALAKYNAGMGNVAKYGGIPPFPETQKFIPGVLDFREEARGRGAVPPTAAAAPPAAGTTGTTPPPGTLFAPRTGAKPEDKSSDTLAAVTQTAAELKKKTDEIFAATPGIRGAITRWGATTLAPKIPGAQEAMEQYGPTNLAANIKVYNDLATAVAARLATALQAARVSDYDVRAAERPRLPNFAENDTPVTAAEKWRIYADSVERELSDDGRKKAQAALATIRSTLGAGPEAETPEARRKRLYDKYSKS